MKLAWSLIVLSAVLAGLAVVLGAAGVAGHGSALPAALLLAVMSYALWRLGRDRMIAHVYADVGREAFDDGRGTDGADPEDWHREGFRYVDVDPEWEDRWESGDVDPEASFFDGEFWREWERSRARRDDGRTRDGTRRDGHDEATGTRTDGSGSAETVDRTTAAACEELGVDPDADEEELRCAYRRRVKETHPDRGGSEAAFRRVQEAYDHLRE